MSARLAERKPTLRFSKSAPFLERIPKRPENNSDFLSSSWLRQEVSHLNRMPEKKEETPWYFLAGTGFFVKEQISQLLRNTKASSGLIAPDVLSLELSKVAVDVEAFTKEYLEQLLNLKLELGWGEDENGNKRIVCPKYGNVLWESVTGSHEREGVVRETVLKTESWLKTAPNNSFAIIISPEGWSGLSDADGKAIHFTETQMNVVHKKHDGNLEAYTFRYKATPTENAVIQSALGLQKPSPRSNNEHKEYIKEILRNVAFISGENPNFPVKSFIDIVNLIQHTLGNREEAYNDKTFDQMRDFIENPDAYSHMHSLVSPLVKRFQEFATQEFNQAESDEEREKNLQIALAVTILQLNKLYRNIRKEEKTRTSILGQTIRRGHNLQLLSTHDGALNLLKKEMNYDKEKEELEKLPGCAGGGSKLQLTSTGAIRTAETTSLSGDEYDFDHEGTCVKCGNGPRMLGPCDICVPCDAELGGKAANGVG